MQKNKLRNKMLNKKLLLASIILGANILSANVLDKKGKKYISWGYNNSTYTNSDIHLKGDGYDYTIYDVEATDRQSDPKLRYLFEITIPQYNLHMGYFFDDRQSIAFEIDHMKYVVKSPQVVKIDGKDHQGNDNDNGTVQLKDFLAFEHTDGLNYFNIAYNYHKPLITDKSVKNALSGFVGIGAGIVIPRSNVTLVGHSARQDAFKLAGYGVHLETGLVYDFLENYFFIFEYKKGYMDMPAVSTSPSTSDEASHDFVFSETSFSLGYMF